MDRAGAAMEFDALASISEKTTPFCCFAITLEEGFIEILFSLEEREGVATGRGVAAGVEEGLGAINVGDSLLLEENEVSPQSGCIENNAIPKNRMEE